jgi:four helix bundle protein
MNEHKRHNFKRLKIWQMGMEITKQMLTITSTFPAHEKYSLKSQIERCSISIPSNIAEGSSRSNKSFSHFIDIALGSSFELQTQILLANYMNYISNENLDHMENKIVEFQKATMSFQNKLNSQCNLSYKSLSSKSQNKKI